MDLAQLTCEWIPGEHLHHIDEGDWGPMYDESGTVLKGIQGKRGVRSRKPDGTWIGADFVQMQPGSAFPMHTHAGDHEIYFIQGAGFVQIDRHDIRVEGGHIIHIPAECAHGIWVPRDWRRAPFIFMAVGHPHQHVDSIERMHTCPDYY
jgi:mannose-6-phosphate isomerase-like protein (cupin superfamily)